MEEILAQDIPQLLHLLTTTKSRLLEVREHVAKVRKHLKVEDHQPEAGISLLELKFQLLLSYLVNLVQLMLLKTDGQYSSSSQPLHRLVEIRTVLEKIRPVDQKLKYQVDKLIRAASTGLASASDPLRFKPNPSNLVSKLKESENSGEDDDNFPNHKVYVPPKAVSAPYKENSQRSGSRRKQRAAFTDELKDEVLDTPNEIKTLLVVGGVQKRKELARESELEQFEENNMIRLSRKRKSYDAGRSNRQEMDELTDFTELGSLTQDMRDHSLRKKYKQSSSTKKAKSFKQKK